MTKKKQNKTKQNNLKRTEKGPHFQKPTFRPQICIFSLTLNCTAPPPRKSGAATDNLYSSLVPQRQTEYNAVGTSESLFIPSCFRGKHLLHNSEFQAVGGRK